MRRREFIRLAGLSGVVMAGGLTIGGRARALAPQNGGAASPYGRWVRRGGRPAFVYSADQDAIAEAEWDPILAPRTRRHWVMVGAPSAHDPGMGGGAHRSRHRLGTRGGG